MRTRTVELPNGFMDLDGKEITTVEIRKLSGNEEDMILDKEQLRDGLILHKLLKACIVGIGTTTDPKKLAQTFDECIPLADMTYMLVALRRWGVSDIYSFDATCEHCGKVGRHRIDLATLEIDKAPEATRFQRVFSEVVEDEGRAVPIEFRTLTARDDKALQEIRVTYKKQKATAQLLLAITKLDNQAPNMKEFAALDSTLRMKIRQAIEAKSGGVDLELLMSCGHCDRTFKDDLPIDLRSFFFPAEDTSATQKATPFRSSGQTSIPWDVSSGGAPAKSAISPSKSEFTT